MQNLASQYQLYRLPWSAVDNVNGWIEITDSCNLNCSVCYRKIRSNTYSLSELKEMVDTTIRMRNCDHIAIAGGEPLLVDFLEDLVEYIKERNVKVTVITNAVLLNEDKLNSLQKAGLDRLTLHIDSRQPRPGWENKTELELLLLKQTYLDMISRYSIQCSLISVVYPETMQYVPDIIRWALENADKISNLTFDLFRFSPLPEKIKSCFALDGTQIHPEKIRAINSVSDEKAIQLDELFAEIHQSIPEFIPHSYLNGTQKQDTVKWLLTSLIIFNKRIIGHVGPKTIELATMLHHLFKGRYPSFIGKNNLKMLAWGLLFDRELRSALLNYLSTCLKNPRGFFNKMNLLTIALIQPTDIYPNGMNNLCDGCPDAILYKDMLVPSCRLDEYRQFGSLLYVPYKES
ncbi:MAG: radical SAM protein [Candidatus Aureabacteria bacterium]|nr:radical SAM protein [Candidatus Auribacterota bacterium]